MRKWSWWNIFGRLLEEFSLFVGANLSQYLEFGAHKSAVPPSLPRPESGLQLIRSVSDRKTIRLPSALPSASERARALPSAPERFRARPSAPFGSSNFVSPAHPPLSVFIFVTDTACNRSLRSKQPFRENGAEIVVFITERNELWKREFEELITEPESN